MKPIKVMIVDDSATVRQVLSTVLGARSDIQVIATAADPLFAMDKMAKDWPDVLVLDIEMPRMDGLTFLRKLMAERPTPVIVCSSLTAQGASLSIQALQAGALSVITKPEMGVADFLRDPDNQLLDAVRVAARARPRQPLPVAPPKKLTADVIPMEPSLANRLGRTTDRVVAIGASTGGTQALEALLSALPHVCPGIAVVQHMPEKFTRAFADRLNQVCEIDVREAQSGDRIMPGLALIAPGGKHLLLRANGARYHVDVVAGPPVNRHCPSVDVLFRSAARCAGANALGILLTGMGDDGARGMREMFDAGAITLAQDEASCVVYGMPKEAVKLGGVRQVLPLAEMPAQIVRFAHA
ncbi:chemotaxis response regulator protein-glutamate methylesterase [Thermomonas sp.]|uniref:protein-glutamate methylesterase/protein-glutamine glutaminase n=1 Tax=Thermomonas sp. TaxID=1971895 RepID=UPI0035B47535